MITSIEQLDMNGTYSYADYLKWAFEERLELLKGKIFRMSPAPARQHQDMSGHLFGAFYSFLKGKPCKIYAAPFDVRLMPSSKKNPKPNQIYTVVQPDICIICDLSKLDAKGCLGAPDLLIEILSPGNTQKEMKDKFDVYEENGVREYWLVEPNDQVILVYILNEKGKYIGLRPFTLGENITSTILPDFAMPVDEVFAE